MSRSLLPATAAALVAALAATAAPAQALGPAREIVDNGKRQGIVGEQADGMLGFVTNAAVDLRAAVGEINEGRARVYAQAARDTGTTAQAAGEAAGRQLTARVPAGQFYRTAEGQWVRR